MLHWEVFLQAGLIVLFIVSTFVGIIMYKSGYWSLEQRKQRWNRTHFTEWK